MINQDSNYVLGVFGGVGPLASSKFIESIYKKQSEISGIEQEFSKVILYSDPSMPDRTEYFLKGMKQVLLPQLSHGLNQLLAMGANEIVICCYTLHYILNDLAHELIKKIIPLPCLALQQVAKLKKRTILICSNGSMKLKIFEASPMWSVAKDYIVKPDAEDQERIHQTIFMLKKNKGYQEASHFIRGMLQKYQAEAWIVGCTEFHLLSAELNFNQQDASLGLIIDPLLITADHANSKYLPFVA